MEDKVQETVVENPVREWTAPRKKVLLSFVGMRDPYNDNNKSKPCTAPIPPQSKPMSFSSRFIQDLQYLFLLRDSLQPGVADPVIAAPSDAPRAREDWGSILTICEELRPDIVYLFPSSRERARDPKNQTEDKACQVRAILQKQGDSPECHILPLDVEDVTNLQELYKCFKNNLLEVLNGLSSEHPQGLSGYDFYFNTSSGTQQMSQIAQLYLSVSQIHPQFYSCVAPQFADAEGRRVRLIEVPLIAETSLLARLEENAKRGYFHAAVSDCASLAESTLLPERRTIARLLGKAFAAYEAMDFMQYGEAFDGIQELESKLEILQLSELREILAQQKAFLEHVKGNAEENAEEESAHNLVDLYFNMARAFERGNYVDVLARFWRLREGVLYYRLSKHGINKRHLADSLPGSLRTLERAYPDAVVWTEMYFKEENLSVFSRILSNVFNDDEIRDFERDFGGDLESLRLTRNRTIVAHGMLPVDREAAATCLQIGERLVDLIPEVDPIPGGRQVYEQYPFTRENVGKLVDLLKRV